MALNLLGTFRLLPGLFSKIMHKMEKHFDEAKAKFDQPAAQNLSWNYSAPGGRLAAGKRVRIHVRPPRGQDSWWLVGAISRVQYASRFMEGRRYVEVVRDTAIADRREAGTA